VGGVLGSSGIFLKRAHDRGLRFTATPVRGVRQGRRTRTRPVVLRKPTSTRWRRRLSCGCSAPTGPGAAPILFALTSPPLTPLLVARGTARGGRPSRFRAVGYFAAFRRAGLFHLADSELFNVVARDVRSRSLAYKEAAARPPPERRPDRPVPSFTELGPGAAVLAALPHLQAAARHADPGDRRPGVLRAQWWQASGSCRSRRHGGLFALISR